MGHYDYRQSQILAGNSDVSFYSLVMAAIRKADTENALKLQAAFPEIFDELKARYHAPGGWLPGEEGA